MAARMAATKACSHLRAARTAHTNPACPCPRHTHTHTHTASPLSGGASRVQLPRVAGEGEGRRGGHHPSLVGSENASLLAASPSCDMSSPAACSAPIALSGSNLACRGGSATPPSPAPPAVGGALPAAALPVAFGGACEEDAPLAPGPAACLGGGGSTGALVPLLPLLLLAPPPLLLLLAGCCCETPSPRTSGGSSSSSLPTVRYAAETQHRGVVRVQALPRHRHSRAMQASRHCRGQLSPPLLNGTHAAEQERWLVPCTNHFTAASINTRTATTYTVRPHLLWKCRWRPLPRPPAHPPPPRRLGRPPPPAAWAPQGARG